ncbi:hypothetical protein GCM10027034_44250 [Ramlibacter solisilvae]|uniref:Methyltransferase type 11 domain-containing protein n=1 Tax=Ramlibacter tataouinensis TaxID=94132 RepID=A0A127JT23_9BURK|nr:class I SAM-dependent methyltransferase [Ramlibacter tataouinensis]AMO23124.1 hypothetical protein UC35_09755 [Ramlibacter tataouinensis]
MYAENRLTHNWLMKKAINDKVRERLPHLAGLVLDLGCGTRPFEADILAHASRYLGVDWGNTLHGSHADIVADLNQSLPLDDESADHVVSFEVMEHLAEPRMMLAEAFRILRRGGQLTLSVPFQWWVHEEPWDYYRYTRHGLEYLLKRAGFTDIRVAPSTGFWSMWFLKLNYQTTRLVRGPHHVKLLVRAALIPFWWINQSLAPVMDRWWPEDRETAGYFVTAAKP